jgi:hypothetical protein
MLTGLWKCNADIDKVLHVTSFSDYAMACHRTVAEALRQTKTLCYKPAVRPLSLEIRLLVPLIDYVKRDRTYQENTE